MEVLADKERIKEFVLFLTGGRNFLPNMGIKQRAGQRR
jgi:hypothetical protein